MKKQHAIIVGGGGAGLLATKILSNFFTNITLIEQDEDFLHPSATRARKSIPQANHLHVFLKSGQELIKTFFPEVFRHLSSRCQTLDWAADTIWYGPFGLYPCYVSQVKTVTHSRMYLDFLMINAVKQMANVTIKIAKVSDFLYDTINKKITGVVFVDEDGREQTLKADLIVEARGKRADLITAFSKLNLHLPSPIEVKTTVGYASRIYAVSEKMDQGKQIYLQPRVDKNKTGVVISPIEDNKFMVTLIGFADARPGRDEKAFNLFLQNLKNTQINLFLKNARAITPVTLYRNMTNRHYHFGRMQNWPKGLVALGDAVCQLNPVYGQGMTLAAQQVAALPFYLASQKPNWEKKFQKKVDKILTLPWLLATAEDLRVSEKKISWHLAIINRYVDLLLNAAVKNKKIHQQFLEVLHTLHFPYHFFLPSLLFNLFRKN